MPVRGGVNRAHSAKWYTDRLAFVWKNRNMFAKAIPVAVQRRANNVINSNAAAVAVGGASAALKAAGYGGGARTGGFNKRFGTSPVNQRKSVSTRYAPQRYPQSWRVPGKSRESAAAYWRRRRDMPMTDTGRGGGGGKPQRRRYPPMSRDFAAATIKYRSRRR